MTTIQVAIVCGTVLLVAAVSGRYALEAAARRAGAARDAAFHARAAADRLTVVAGALDEHRADTTHLLAVAGERLAAAAEALERHRGEHGPTRLGHRVTVHTKQPDDQTLFGVVVGDYSDRITLDDAEYVTAAGARALPGRQDIDRSDIAWIDVHGHVDRDRVEAA